jgi:hypothetical protein
VPEHTVERVRRIWCCALQDYVACVTNDEEEVVAIICAERRNEARTCRAKTHALQEGLIGDLLRPAAVDVPLASRCTLG